MADLSPLRCSDRNTGPVPPKKCRVKESNRSEDTFNDEESKGSAMTTMYDIAFLGHYTKDTIVSAEGTRVVDGGAFNYGSHVAIRMGLNVAAITRLAREDFGVVDELKALGVDVFAKTTPHSTCLRLEYPTSNVDERILTITSS